MNVDINFLFDNQLISAVEQIIKDSKHELLLISPYIDLDERIQAALKEKITKYDFELRVLFGKNEDNYYKSIKKDSLEFFKQFPNVEIRYNERLHAKYYQNDFDFIITSLNLYDYSLANNIEVGFICQYASKGLIGKVFESGAVAVAQGIEKARHEIFGSDKEVNPIEKFKLIYESSDIKYKTEPIIVEKEGLRGMLGGKKLNSFKVTIDNFNANEFSTQNISKLKEIKAEKSAPSIPFSGKTVSASQLAKSLGTTTSEVAILMQQAGLIDGDKITPLGVSKGLVMKSYMGKDYISYPENLSELNQLAKT